MEGREQEERIKEIQMPLLSWYGKVRRELPWRKDRDAYKIWVSEIMLQQTRIEAVKPYYARFMAEFPTIQDLAEAEEEKLLKLWEGLGYYSRARNLKKCAMEVVKTYGGRFPQEEELLKKLPGIGPYTAGAIASIAYGQPVPAVDGNVLRVLARVLADPSDIMLQSTRRNYEEWIRHTIPGEYPDLWNEAVMELGETVCIPNGKPNCESCPLQKCCESHKRGEESFYPVKSPKRPRRQEEKTLFILLAEEGETLKVGIQKRQDRGLLAGLYEFPSVEGHLSLNELADLCEERKWKVTDIREMGAARHIFTHVEWNMIGYAVWISSRKGQKMPPLFVGEEELRHTYPIPTAFSFFKKKLEEILSLYPHNL